jgi:hypothetical protein
MHYHSLFQHRRIGQLLTTKSQRRASKHKSQNCRRETQIINPMADRHFARSFFFDPCISHSYPVVIGCILPSSLAAAVRDF